MRIATAVADLVATAAACAAPDATTTTNTDAAAAKAASEPEQLLMYPKPMFRCWRDPAPKAAAGAFVAANISVFTSLPP